MASLKKIIPFLVLLGAVYWFFFKSPTNKLIDKNATEETVNLFNNLKRLSVNHTLFGHQHATEYGRGWQGDKDRSDVKSVVGSHPAVIGVDLSGLSGQSERDIKKYESDLRQNVIDTYERGGITTISWLFTNPVSKDGFYWNDSISIPAVKYIIPGGDAHEKYKVILDRIGTWAKSLKASDGNIVPVIFRPYHKFDGDKFWWGKSHCTPEEFIELWRFTVTYLRDEIGVHNFIYAYSSDNNFDSEDEYLERYPGDDWVDMVGMDNYADLGRDQYDLETAIKKLKIVSDFAIKKGKLAAFTETGLESITHVKWWTEVLLKVLKADGLQLSYVLVWRNDVHSSTHYYAPFPRHSSSLSFIDFFNDKLTLFEKDLKNIYKR